MNTQHDELDWLAFCYAAGELTAGDAAAFEARLADEQEAREALARAVEMSEVVATAESLAPVVVARSQSSVWMKRVVWMAIGSAASLLVALLWSGGSALWPDRTVASSDRALLADAWSRTRQELAESDSDLWYPKHLAASESTAELFDARAPLAADDGELLEQATPSWMTAAVETYPNEPTDPDSTPFDGERSEN
jgi:hypothetical protein